MCGIWGHINLSGRGTNSSDCKILRELAVAGTVRGYDGTGMLYQSAAGKNFYHKGPDHALAVLEKESWYDSFGGMRFVLGHNRAATMGGYDVESTHPFINNHVSGVHNGTIQGFEFLWPEAKAEMDSAALFEVLNETPEDDEEVCKFLEAIPWTGAYSLVWFDGRLNALRFARNKERPMHILNTGDGIFFGSELPMLKWILGRNKVRIHESVSLDTGKLLTVPLDGETEATWSDYDDDNYDLNAYDNWTYGSARKGAVTYDRPSYNQDPYTAGTARHASSYPVSKSNASSNSKFYDLFKMDNSFEDNLPSDFDPFRHDMKRELQKFFGSTNLRRSTSSLYEDMLYSNYIAAQRTDWCDTDPYPFAVDEDGPTGLPVHVVATLEHGDVLLGYTDMGTYRAPVAVRCWDSKVVKAVGDLLAKDKIAIVGPQELQGVRLYHTGDVVPVMGAVFTKHEEYDGYVKSGGVLCSADVDKFGLENPFITCLDLDANWSKGWAVGETELNGNVLAWDVDDVPNSVF